MFGRKKPPTAPPPPAAVDWADIDEVRREWPPEGLDAAADLGAWRQGNEVYDANDDYESMMRSGALLCQALRHDLYGESILAGSDLPQTTHRVMFASAFSPPDGQTFSDQAARQLRLGLTVVKKYAWQQPEYGGSGTMAKLLEASYMVLSMAVASPDRLWEGDLKKFFTTCPIEISPTSAEVAPLAHRDPLLVQETQDLLARGRQMLDEASQGDVASQARVQGVAAGMAGDLRTALRHFEEAAQLGDVESMYDAGCTARDLEMIAQSTYWFEAAAAAGDSSAMYNLGARSYSDGDHAAAREWWQRSGAAGEASAYAGLTQLADELQDEHAELQWARLGAEAEHPFCMMRYGQLMMRSHPGDTEVTTSQVIPLLIRAAEAGQDGAPFLVGIAYGQIGDMSNARLWLRRAEAAGDADATRVMRENNL